MFPTRQNFTITKKNIRKAITELKEENRFGDTLTHDEKIERIHLHLVGQATGVKSFTHTIEDSHISRNNSHHVNRRFARVARLYNRHF